MQAWAEVIGVHEIQTADPAHLIELFIKDADNFDWTEVTQEIEGQRRSNWQVAYDEQLLKETEHGTQFVFFFHYLDFSKPLLTSIGPLEIPGVTPIPTYLKGIMYYPPD